jgi:hypothetical protein
MTGLNKRVINALFTPSWHVHPLLASLSLPALPSMISAADSNLFTFFKRTRKGKVLRFVREKYVRSDLGYGVLHGNVLDSQTLQRLVEESNHKTLVFVDTNIVLHEIDLLEQQSPATSLLVFTQTVLQELRHLNFAAFKRAQALMEDNTRSIIFFPNELSQQSLHLRFVCQSSYMKMPIKYSYSSFEIL